MDYEGLCKRSHRIFKSKLGDKEADELRGAIGFLGMDVKPEETKSLAKMVGALGLGAGLLLVAILSLLLGFSVMWFLFLAFPLVMYSYLKKYPTLKADSERRKALAQMPEAMSYLIMSLQVNPNLEKAVEFAASHSKGLFKRKLDGIIGGVDRGIEGAEAGLLKLGEDFASRSEEFKRSMSLVLASTLERTDERRQETLDKAAEVLLEGLASRTEREARALNTPVMIVFTFGVILPLIFVAIIPFMSLMGIEIGAPGIAMMYTVGLPLFLFVLIRFIASSRPMTMLPPSVPAGKRRVLPLVLSACAGLALSLAVLLGEGALGPLEYVPVLWGVGVGMGIFMLMATARVKRLRREVKMLESGLGETLHQLGVILSEGRPLEDAMARSDAPFMRGAAENVRTLSAGLNAAFFDERFGSLKEVYSDTIKGIVEIVVSISDKGSESLASVSFKLGEHVRNLKKSEAEIERSLGSVVSSMRIIALVVAPLVGGMISSMSVVLAETMVASQGVSMGFASQVVSPIDPSVITMIIGIYAMESAVILVLFGSELINGDDAVMKKYWIGLALPISILVFTVCAWVASGLFGGIA